MNFPYFNIKDDLILEAGPKDTLYKYSNIYNLSTFGPVVHIRLNPFVHKTFRLMRIFESPTCDDVFTYTYDYLDRPWVDIPVDCLNLDIGLHTYTLEFINTITGDTFYQYFNYTIQSDNPNKPYIYMNR